MFSTRWMHRCGVAAVTLALGAAGLAASSYASSTTHKRQLGPIQQGLAFYRGKTVTLIAPAAPGGSEDVTARIAQGYLAAYLHCTVNVLDNGNGGGWPALDQAAAAAPDGLTVGLLSTAKVIEAQLANQPALNFNPIREAFLGQAGPSVSIWVSSPSSPYTSFDTVVHSQTPVTMLSLTNGVGFLNEAVVNGIFGVKARYIAYPTTAPMLQGFLRGDGPLTTLSSAMVGGAVIGGQARPLLYTNPLPAVLPLAARLKGVPTVAAYGAKHPPKTKDQRLALAAYDQLLQESGNVFFMPGKVAPARVAAFQAAVAYALGPVSRTTVIQEGALPGDFSGPAAKKAYLYILGLGRYLSRYLASFPT